MPRPSAASLRTALVVTLAAAALAGCASSGGVTRVRLSERECLARAMYFESNRSSDAGMLAVGTVVMNRVKAGKYGRNICEVVGAPRQFAPGVLSKPMTDRGAPRARRVADHVLAGKRHPGVQNAQFFHTYGYRFPYKNMRYVLTAGGNTFYDKVKAPKTIWGGEGRWAGPPPPSDESSIMVASAPKVEIVADPEPKRVVVASLDRPRPEDRWRDEELAADAGERPASEREWNERRDARAEPSLAAPRSTRIDEEALESPRSSGRTVVVADARPGRRVEAVEIGSPPPPSAADLSAPSYRPERTVRREAPRPVQAPARRDAFEVASLQERPSARLAPRVEAAPIAAPLRAERTVRRSEEIAPARRPSREPESFDPASQGWRAGPAPVRTGADDPRYGEPVADEEPYALSTAADEDMAASRRRERPRTVAPQPAIAASAGGFGDGYDAAPAPRAERRTSKPQAARWRTAEPDDGIGNLIEGGLGGVEIR